MVQCLYLTSPFSDRHVNEKDEYGDSKGIIKLVLSHTDLLRALIEVYVSDRSLLISNLQMALSSTMRRFQSPDITSSKLAMVSNVPRVIRLSLCEEAIV